MEFYSLTVLVDIDHLTRVLVLSGTPSEETLAKITSEEVGNVWYRRWQFCMIS